MSGSFDLLRTVSDEDIDLLGHMSNIAYVRWVQDAAVGHSEAVGLDFAAYVKLGAVFVIRRHEIDYLRPALRGESLSVRTWVASAEAAKCSRATEIRREHPEGEPVVKAVTTWGFVDARTGRPTRISDDIRRAFGVAPRRPSRADV